MLEKINVAVEGARRVAQNKRTIFGVGFVPSVVYGQLPILIRRLRHNDNVELVLMELMTLQQVEALKAGRIDIGFGRIPIDDPQIEQEMLFDEPIIAALPCSHPLARTTPSLAELAEWPLIIYPATVGPNFTDIVLGLFRRSGLAINVIQQVNELQTALGLVASELGFTLVPEQVRRIQRDDIAYVSLAEDNITSPILCCRRKEPPSAIMLQANEILSELVENRLTTGRYR
ncbi:MAG: LysR substrate-binding domain-containing protein [Hyphomicrobium sp.]